MLIKKYLKMLGVLLGASLLLIVAPLYLTNPSYGEPLLLSIPPTLFIAVTWMGGAWWARNKPELMLALTVGMMPLRGIFLLIWIIIVGASQTFVLGMMLHWIIFVIPEVAFFLELNSLREREKNND